ncbi:aldehyde dehydrogenase [Roseivirga pacifica]
METSLALIQDKHLALKNHYTKGQTQAISTRINALKKLRSAIIAAEKEILDALHKDLRKSPEEAYITEIALVLKELSHHINHLKKWTKTKRVSTPLFLLPSSSRIRHEPMGTVLIIAPWNYPFQLLMTPLIGAVSAGNTVMLKPSEHCINTNAVMDTIVQSVFNSAHVSLVHGGKDTNQALFAQRFDKIFFTGSPRLGKIVMKAAAEHLTPVVLELGGKSPCIVDRTANIDVAAKRIAWGKTVNLGQTCIAPDYLLVDETIKNELQERITHHWKTLFGDNPQESTYLPRMVTHEAFDRVSAYLQQGKVLFGGETNREDKFISPTLMDDVDLDAPIMQDEIFGPILPIISFKTIDEATDFINAREKPLAYYYFGDNGKIDQLLSANTSGGACFNDTLIHISNHGLPFGGVGTSGMGQYHGKASFEAFSNTRSFMKSPTWIDLPFRYPPFKHFSMIKKLLR